MEEWKDIAGYELYYQISNIGQVKRKDTGKILKNNIRNGYEYVTLCVNGQRKKFYVHRLVAIAFIPNPKSYEQVNHKDGNKSNNKVDNLEWCTQKENLMHAFCTGLNTPTIENLIRFDRKPVIRIEDGKWFSGVTEAANQMGVCEAAMSKCLNKGLSATCCGYHWKFA
jgi:hypothetical protein